jgi:hypothetical protein
MDENLIDRRAAREKVVHFLTLAALLTFAGLNTQSLPLKRSFYE